MHIIFHVVADSFVTNQPSRRNRGQDVRTYNLGGMGCSANVGPLSLRGHVFFMANQGPDPPPQRTLSRVFFGLRAD